MADAPTTADENPPTGEGAVERAREELVAEREQLRHQLEERGDGGSGAEFDENFADTAQVAAEQVENRTLAAQLRDQLDDVEAALSRLDDGTYGSCKVCEQRIADARLEAMPATRYCIEHAGG